jgi:hypothetical protein
MTSRWHFYARAVRRDDSLCDELSEMRRESPDLAATDAFPVCITLSTPNAIPRSGDRFGGEITIYIEQLRGFEVAKITGPAPAMKGETR